MKILWIVNNIMPELAKETGLATSASGSWLIDLSNQLKKEAEIELAIAAVGGNSYQKLHIDNITYYLLPGTGRNMLFYTKSYEKLWKKINDDFKPDIVHLYGTEYGHGLSFLRANPDVKAVVSVQGIISRIKDVIFDGLPKFFDLRYATLKEYINLNGLYLRYLLYKMNSKREKEIFSRVKYASVVNSWDYAVSRSFNPDLKLFRIEYNLRESFYSAEKWDIEKIDNNQIFSAPGGDPIKGLHVLLRALAILKRKHKSIKLIVPGINSNESGIIADSGYKKYVKKLIKRFDLKENVLFVGRLSEEEMVDYMKSSRMVVIPSAIEGTSLVLREAMYLGVPCISSFRGGMADFIDDKTNGFLYDFSEYAYLALRMESLLEDDELAKKFSENGRSKALTTHDRINNVKANLDMYAQIYKGEL